MSFVILYLIVKIIPITGTENFPSLRTSFVEVGSLFSDYVTEPIGSGHRRSWSHLSSFRLDPQTIQIYIKTPLTERFPWDYNLLTQGCLNPLLSPSIETPRNFPYLLESPRLLCNNEKVVFLHSWLLNYDPSGHPETEKRDRRGEGNSSGDGVTTKVNVTKWYQRFTLPNFPVPTGSLFPEVTFEEQDEVEVRDSVDDIC